jgi:hypothetical protein
MAIRMSERSPLCRHEALREECAICKPFIEASRRRRENGIKLKRFAVMCDETQVEALNILWGSFVERWGKQQAVDHLIVILSKVEARLRDKERA